MYFISRVATPKLEKIAPLLVARTEQITAGGGGSTGRPVNGGTVGNHTAFVEVSSGVIAPRDQTDSSSYLAGLFHSTHTRPKKRQKTM